MAAATADKVRMTTASKVAPGALQHTAALLWPSLKQQRVAARREQLLDALQVKRGDGRGGGIGRRRKAGTGKALGEGGGGETGCSFCMRLPNLYASQHEAGICWVAHFYLKLVYA